VKGEIIPFSKEEMKILEEMPTYFRPHRKQGCFHQKVRFMGNNCRGEPVFLCLDPECELVFARPMQFEIDVCPRCGFKNNRQVVK
jgi:hypothetical protein